MTAPQSHSFDPSEALALIQHELASPHPDLTAIAFEFSSRGDRVPGQLLRPGSGDGPFPLLLVVRADTNRNPFPEAACELARSGAAVASIDLPLYGKRESSKLSARLQEGLGQKTDDDSVWKLLWSEFLIQAPTDIRRALDAACKLSPIDCERIVLAGSNLAALMVAISTDERPCALALTPGNTKAGAAELEALHPIAIPTAITESKSNLTAALKNSASEPTLTKDLAPFVREHLGV